MSNVKILDISIPEYVADSVPDRFVVGTELDRLLVDNFSGMNVVLRCISSKDHADKTIDEVADIILQIGTDKYDSSKTGLGYEVGLNTGKSVDFFGTKELISADAQIFTSFLLHDFYYGAMGDRGYPVRIDIIMVYDASKLTMLEHLYGNDMQESDGFIFSDPDNKTAALIGLIKIR